MLEECPKHLERVQRSPNLAFAPPGTNQTSPLRVDRQFVMRISNELCYNTFPIPKISDDTKDLLKEMALKLLVDERERHFEKNISEL